jgi:TonB-linked SusC/RagA family outer membrane protein
MQDINGGIQEWALLSQLARVNYDYDDKYLLTASIRRDGSSRFGEANRYGFFPSFSLGWRVSDEAFMNNLDWLTNLKFRAGWGQTGNQEIGNYRHYSQLGLVGWVSGQTLLLNSGVAPLEYPNRGLKWESTEMTNIGLDAGFLNNQITMVLEYYFRGTDGMLLEQPLPGSAGYRRDPVRNVGEITNQGVEAILTYKKVSGNFNYTFQLNGAYNENEVKSLGGSFAIPGASQSDAAMGFLTRTQEGYPMGSFYGWVTDGIFQSSEEVALAPYQTPETAAGDIRFRDLDGDYQITGEDRTFLGSPWPDFTYGFNANIGYRNFSLSIFLQGVYGNEIYFMDRTFYESLSGSLNQSLNVLEDHYWTPENPSQTMPRAIAGNPNANNRFSDRFVEDGSYLRLKNVVLSYDLPVNLIERMRIKGFQVYLKGNNLFTLTKFSGLDPEIGEFNNNSLNAGIAIGQYPVSRIFTVGLNITL